MCTYTVEKWTDKSEQLCCRGGGGGGKVPPSVMESRQSSQFLLHRRLRGARRQQESRWDKHSSEAVLEDCGRARALRDEGLVRKEQKQGKGIFSWLHFHKAPSSSYSNKLFKYISNQRRVANGSTASTDFISIKPPGRQNDCASSYLEAFEYLVVSDIQVAGITL